jgi:MbtH protein
MSDEELDDTTIYRVVLNHEEQYSIWPVDRDLPPGWRDEGTTGPKASCLAHIDEVWTDMRPLSLRKFMQEAASAFPPCPSSWRDRTPSSGGSRPRTRTSSGRIGKSTKAPAGSFLPSTAHDIGCT